MWKIRWIRCGELGEKDNSERRVGFNGKDGLHSGHTIYVHGFSWFGSSISQFHSFQIIQFSARDPDNPSLRSGRRDLAARINLQGSAGSRPSSHCSDVGTSRKALSLNFHLPWDYKIKKASKDAFLILRARDPAKLRRDFALMGKSGSSTGRNDIRTDIKKKRHPFGCLFFLSARDSANAYCEFNRS